MFFFQRIFFSMHVLFVFLWCVQLNNSDSRFIIRASVCVFVYLLSFQLNAFLFFKLYI